MEAALVLVLVWAAGHGAAGCASWRGVLALARKLDALLVAALTLTIMGRQHTSPCSLTP